MNITKIKVKNFKKLNEKEISFDKGINIIKGKNEQGKSTLLKAISAGLFIDPSSSKYKEEYKSWDSSMYPIISMEFYDDNEKQYNLFKDFNTKETILKDIEKDEKNYSVLIKKIKEITGYSNLSLFTSTVCINHDEMALLESGKKSLQDAIQEVLLNNENVNLINLLKDIKSKSDQLQIGLYHPAKNNGVIKKLQDESNLLESEIEKLKHKEKGVGNSVTNLEKLEKELKDVDGEIVKYTKIVADFEKKESIDKDLEVINNSIKNDKADLDKVREMSERLKELTKKFASLGGKEELDIIDKNHESIVALTKKIDDKKRELVEIPIEEPSENKPKGSLNSIISLTVSIICFFMVCFGIFFYASLIYIGILIEIIYLIYIKFTKPKPDKDDLVSLSSPNESINKEIVDLTNSLNKIFEECKVESQNQYYEKRTMLRALNADGFQLQNTINAILRNQKIEDIEKRLEENKNKKSELEINLPEIGNINRDKYLRDKRELELLNLDRNDILKEITEERTKIQVVEISPSEVQDKETKLGNVKSELKKSLHYLEVLKAIYTSLLSTKDEIVNSVSSRVEASAQRYLLNITNNKYEKMKLDNNFNIELFSSEKKEFLKVENNLSKGAIDQVYLSLRLALNDVIASSKKVPLFFDDPFLSFDEERRNKLMNELKLICENHQIFIFTCHNFFDDFGNVINIEEK